MDDRGWSGAWAVPGLVLSGGAKGAIESMQGKITNRLINHPGVRRSGDCLSCTLDRVGRPVA